MPCQIIRTLKMDSASHTLQAFQDGGTAPAGADSTHAALLGPVSAPAPSCMPMASSCQVPKCTGVPGLGYPYRAVRVSIFLRQSNVASWLRGQLPGPLGS